MRADAILLPVCAQVFLTLLVWIWMYYTRLTTLYRSRANVQDLADDSKHDAILASVANPSDNFENLFELPVLFYVAGAVIFMTGSTDSTYVGLAWTFVGFRALHSLVHCTINRIKWRFAAYLLGALVLWAIWIRFAIQLLSLKFDPM